jgi:hypothetical protein
MGDRLGGESPLEEEVVLTPSRRQLRRREAEESVLLVLVAVIAVIPRTRVSCREETVSSVEYRS